MKKLIYIMTAILGAAFMTSCTGSATMVGGTVGYGYGYYDNVYFHGHPGLHRNNVVIVNNHTQHNTTTVGARNSRSTTKVAPNNRQKTRRASVQNNQHNTRSSNVTAPSRANTNVNRSAAPSPARTTAPSSRSGASTTRAARGGR
ncbi:hypothetical protein [Anditalea andensis]|uniref:Lipoprotein n=1 Tax=Anditalea andensis TaxID=1048983 RepID=A0A074KZN8_9BACT|nr:hypothetical protein [Anditalea andensis]KEO73650.1 hypothetical protein EL17_12180 [Anditalea andensis]